MRATSALVGKDHQALSTLLAVHAPAAPRILDSTYGGGTMWEGLTVDITKMDLVPQAADVIEGDFTAMPFEADTFEIVMFDPPHLPTHAASANSSKMSVPPSHCWHCDLFANRGFGEVTTTGKEPPICCRRPMYPTLSQTGGQRCWRCLLCGATYSRSEGLTK